MAYDPIATLKTGGQAAALALLTATGAMAQTIPTLPPGDEITTLEEIEFPVLDAFETDQQVIDSLSAQGYEAVVVMRSDEALIVSAERGALPTEMIFNAADGTLLLVDGIEPTPAAD